jgi:hypothetical protein
MCKKPRGKFNWFDEDQLTEIGFMPKSNPNPTTEQLIQLRNYCVAILRGKGFQFFNNEPEYRVVLRRNGCIKEFAVQFHHINR